MTLITELPPTLRPVGRMADRLGDGDGRVSAGEVALIQADLSARPDRYTSEQRRAVDRLAGLVDRAAPSSPAAVGRASVGVGGIYQSEVFAPQDGFQREVITFATPSNPGGLQLRPGEDLVVPRQLAGDGVVGVNIQTSGPLRGAPGATIGGQRLGAFSGAGRHGAEPIHGEMTLRAGSASQVTSVEILHAVPGPFDTTDYFPIQKTVRAGETLDIPLSSHRTGRGLDQIESIWHGTYRVPDPSGRKSDEGKPFYLDGVYADLYLVDASGRERKVDRTKFIDANEVDNSHDLGGPKGETLRYKFFARNPAGENHAVTLRGVRFKYLAEAGATRPYRASIGKIFSPGERAEIQLPPELRGKTIGKVDVRWTDMLSGTWTRPGYARGTLVVDGRRVGKTEGVQSPETQTFDHLGGIKAEGGRVGVEITNDRAQVDWVEVFFED